MRIRIATDADAETLGRMRWDLVEGADPGSPDRAAFVTMFAAWAREHAATHLAFLAVVDDEPVGIAWLALVARPPSLDNPYRIDGDVQSVYVLEQWRNRGIGGQLIAALLAEAQARGANRISVQAGERPRPFYRRFGFGPDDYVLHLANAQGPDAAWE